MCCRTYASSRPSPMRNDSPPGEGGGCPPAVPRERDQLARGGLDVLQDVRLEQVVVHAERLAPRVEAALVEVVAVAALQVAERPDRLRHDDLERGARHAPRI